MGNAYHDYQMPVTGDQLKNYHVSHGSVDWKDKPSVYRWMVCGCMAVWLSILRMVYLMKLIMMQLYEVL